MAGFQKGFLIIVKSCWLANNMSAQLSACEKNQVPEAFGDQFVAVFDSVLRIGLYLKKMYFLTENFLASRAM